MISSNRVRAALLRYTLPSALAAGAVALAISVWPVNAQEPLACEAGMRVFDHPLLLNGAICVPEAPQRVAFIDDNIVYGMELGIPSVTRSYYSDVIVADFPGLAALFDPATTTHVGNTWEMNGELLLAAQPDLVITGKYWDAAIAYAEDLAPTIVIDDERAETWLDIPRMLAALFGKEEEQAELEASVDARLSLLRTALTASGASPSFSFTQIEAADSFWTFTTEAFGAAFAVEAGMRTGDTIPTPDEAERIANASRVAVPVSTENLAFIDADHLFFYANLGTDPQQLVASNAVFQRFASQRPGRIHFIPGEYWFRGSASSAHRIIDDLYRDVLGQDPEAVSPNPFRWTYVP